MSEFATLNIQESDRSLLILASSTYTNDTDFKTALKNYIGTIEIEGWITTILEIDPYTTYYTDIAEMLEHIYPTATLSIGEDICFKERDTTHWGGEYWYAPNINPFLLGTLAPYPPQLIEYYNPFFFLMPYHNLAYTERRDHLINVLNRFSTNRNLGDIYSDTARIYFDSMGGFWSEDDWKPYFNKYEEIIFNPPSEECTEQNSIIVLASGHASPSCCYEICTDPEGKNALTPILSTDGCYCYYWRSGTTPSPLIDGCLGLPKSGRWQTFNNVIFDNDNLRVCINQGVNSKAYLLSEQLNGLHDGLSVAECFKNKNLFDQATLIGDPTAHL